MLLVGFFASVQADGVEPSGGAAIPVPSDIQAVVFRRELATASNQYAYCLSVDGRDPELRILKAVQRKDVLIVPASECVAADDTLRGSYLKANHHRATIISIGPYKPVDDSTGSLTIESYQGGLDASGGTLLLRKTPGGWVAENSGYRWES